MQVDRSNYEILIIDWLDGKLDDSQVEQLKEFLAENPEMIEESNGLPAMKLNSQGESFSNKMSLKKSAKDLSPFQFEHLSIAYMENDLSINQKEELEEVIANDEEKKRVFDLIQKTKLVPEDLKYRYPNRLYRKIAIRRSLVISLTGLSAAAIVTIMITINTVIKKNRSIKTDNPIETLIAVDNPVLPQTNKSDNKSISEEILPDPVVEKKEREKHIESKVPDMNIALVKTTQDVTNSQPEETVTKNNLLAAINPVPITSGGNINFDVTTSNELVKFNSASILNFQSDNVENDNITGFIAKIFKEKILKEKNPNNNKLGVFEIAEAGVKGLNKLLGWEMQLAKNDNTNGELKSVYFSSNLLEFNAPVKKSDSLP